MEFEKKIKPYLVYIGTLGAILTSIAYIISLLVLIKGFEYQQKANALIYAIVNAVVGLIILNFLKYQGVCLAREKNRETLDLYYATKTKDKKNHNMGYFWATTLVKDVLIKGIAVCVTTCGLIYFIIEGSNDWNLLLLGIVNLVMFISFGLIALDKAYEYYNNVYVNYMKEKINGNKT